MARTPYVLRHELTAGNNFDGSPPPDNPRTNGVIFTHPSREQGGLFNFSEWTDQFYQLVRVVVHYEDATDVKVTLRHQPRYGDGLNKEIGDSTGYDTLVARSDGSSVTSSSPYVDAEVTDASTRLIVTNIDWMFLVDERVTVETTGASNEIWAEVAGIPVNTSPGPVGLPFDRRG